MLDSGTKPLQNKLAPENAKIKRRAPHSVRRSAFFISIRTDAFVQHLHARAPVESGRASGIVI